ncbi:MAG: hypothetical protein QG574_2211 [Cyanobacteriota bacterium erpe_2018_sw_21hr_WHONDRS-SW48-000092_B_bin.40]|nr:hypothetical protein [Cyanobacteriota bacterium erpe_2018_sw_21hr_WHONDRS-SW48-000092_B_bin.40]
MIIENLLNRFERWSQFLLAKTSAYSLAVFRILFGLLMSAYILVYLLTGRLQGKYLEPKFLFPFFPSQALPDHLALFALFILMAVAALFVGLGLFYRISALFFCLSITYVFLLDRSQYLNHSYLICLLSLLLTVVEADSVYSLDNLLWRKKERLIPRWNLLILRIQLFIVYLYGGIWKLNPDWLSGEPQRTWLLHKAAYPLIGPIISQEWFVWVVTFGGILVDFSLPFLLIFRPTFPFGVAVAMFFHITNSVLFKIGVFPWLMLATISLFPPANWPVTVSNKLAVWLNKPSIALPSATISSVKIELSLRSGAAFLSLLFFHLYVIGQLLFPLRHFAYPGNVDWTEEGYYFSWRMMLHHKDARLVIYRTDPETGEVSIVNQQEWLTKRQMKVMKTQPDMVHQFCRWLADLEERKTGKRPHIRVKLIASLNGHPFRELIDPNVDLGSEPFTLNHKSWIID